MLAASNGKRYVTVWRPSVYPILHNAIHQGAARDAASLHFHPSIRCKEHDRIWNKKCSEVSVDALRGVDTIETLEQMLQTKSWGNDFGQSWGEIFSTDFCLRVYDVFF